MGCYDDIVFKCPSCGEEIVSQSKSGPCLLGSYHIDKVPYDVAADCNRHAPFECHYCGKMWILGSKIPKFVSLDVIEYEGENIE